MDMDNIRLYFFKKLPVGTFIPFIKKEIDICYPFIIWYRERIYYFTAADPFYRLMKLKPCLLSE